MSIVIRDGKVYDGSSVELTFDGNTIPVSVEMDYDSGEVEESYIHSGGKPVGRTPGQQKPVPVTIKMPVDQWHQLRDALGSKYKRKEFEATVAMTDTDGEVITDQINRLRILNDKVSVGTGSDATMQELTCQSLEVLPNGTATF